MTDVFERDTDEEAVDANGSGASRVQQKSSPVDALHEVFSLQSHDRKVSVVSACGDL